MDNTIEEKLDRLLTLIEETLVVRKEDKEYRQKHAEEHSFLRTLIEDAEYSKQFKRELTKKLVSGGIWALIVAIGSSLAFTIKHWITG